MSETTTPDWRTMKAGRELDALVAVRGMGWFQRVDYDYRPPQIEWHDQYGCQALVNDPGQLPNLPLWSPSTDIAAAFHVVEAMRARGYVYEIGDVPRDPSQQWAGFAWRHHAAECGPYDVVEYAGSAAAASLPLAICRAALEALDAPEAKDKG